MYISVTHSLRQNGLLACFLKSLHWLSLLCFTEFQGVYLFLFSTSRNFSASTYFNLPISTQFLLILQICSLLLLFNGASLVAQRLKHLSAMQEAWVQSLGRENALEKEMAAHSSTLAWRIPWTGERGGLQRVTKSRTRLSDLTST